MIVDISAQQSGDLVTKQCMVLARIFAAGLLRACGRQNRTAGRTFHLASARVRIPGETVGEVAAQPSHILMLLLDTSRVRLRLGNNGKAASNTRYPISFVENIFSDRRKDTLEKDRPVMAWKVTLP